MSTRAMYVLSHRLLRMGVRPYRITHEYKICPVIASRAWEALHSSLPLTNK